MLSKAERKLAYRKRSDAIHKKRFNSLLLSISKKDLVDIYTKNDIIFTSRYFKTSEENIYRLLKHYKVPRRLVGDLFINKLKEKISKEKLQEVYYRTKSEQQTCKETGLKLTGLKKLLAAYNIPLIPASEKYSAAAKKAHKARIDTEDNIKLLQELYEIKRYPMYRICQELHMSDTVVKRLIEQNNFYRSPSLYPSNNNSAPNLAFAKLLDDNGLKYEREFRLYDPRSGSNYKHYQYDFKIGKYLVEINPSATHNITQGARGGLAHITPIYHKKKSILAQEHGNICIHVWDWSDRNKVIDFLKSDLSPKVSFEEPRKYIFSLKSNKLVNNAEDIKDDCVVIYDDGAVGLPDFNC